MNLNLQGESFYIFDLTLLTPNVELLKEKS